MGCWVPLRGLSSWHCQQCRGSEQTRVSAHQTERQNKKQGRSRQQDRAGHLGHPQGAGTMSAGTGLQREAEPWLCRAELRKSIWSGCGWAPGSTNHVRVLSPCPGCCLGVTFRVVLVRKAFPAPAALPTASVPMFLTMKTFLKLYKINCFSV